MSSIDDDNGNVVRAIGGFAASVTNAAPPPINVDRV
jgi:hypothetical protein